MWKLFNEFFIRLDIKPNNWEDRIVLFSGYLIDNDKKSLTVKSYISVIKAVLEADDVEVNENRYLINSLTRACCYRSNKVRTRLPIRKNLLFMLMDKIPTVFQGEQPYLITMYKALFITAYFRLFRVGEIMKSQHVLKAKDVKIAENQRKIKFIFRMSKTHWKNMKPHVIKISSEGELLSNSRKKSKRPSLRHYCPFTELQNFIAIRKHITNENEQCFVFQDGAPVKPEHYRAVLKKTISLCGLDLTNYGCHSTR